MVETPAWWCEGCVHTHLSRLVSLSRQLGREDDTRDETDVVRKSAELTRSPSVTDKSVWARGSCL